MDRRRGVTIARLALAVAVLTASCSQILGAGDYRTRADDGAARSTDAGDGAAPGKIAFASLACEACIERECPSERSSCEGNGNCREFFSCAYACDAPSCAASCYQSSPEPEAGRGLTVCTYRHCGDECVSCDAPLSRYGAICADCIAQDTGPGGACTLMQACFRDPGCSAYLACLARECVPFGDSDPRCRLTCGMEQPEGARTFYKGFGTRYFLGCGQACGGGKQWECTQMAVWPPVASPDSTATLRVRGTASQVKACSLNDPVCANPIDEGPFVAREGATGEAEAILSVPPAASTGGSYYLETDDPTGTFASRIFVPGIPIPGDLTLWFPGVTDPAELAAATAVRPETIDRSLAMLEVTVVDCLGGLADWYSVVPEITITVSVGARPYYSNQGAFSAVATGGGDAMFVNLTADVVALTVRRGQSIIAEAPNVPLRAGGFTRVTFNYPQFF